MNELDLTLPPELESALMDYYTAPTPNPAFAARLDFDLRRRFDEFSQTLKKRSFGMETFMQTARTRPFLAIILSILALLILMGACYAVGRLAGFIPGYGFTSDTQGMYVLSEPVTVKKNGFVIKLEKAIQDKDSLVIELNTKNDTRYIQSVSIILANGDRVDAVKLFQSGANQRFEFPPLADPFKPLVLSIPIRNGEYLKLPFQLRPVQPDDIVVQSTQIAPMVNHHDGLALSLDSIVYASDKTILQVFLKFDQPGNIGGQWGVVLTDENGTPYPLQDITPPSESYHMETSADGKTSSGSMDDDAVRVYETVPLAGKGSLKLSLSVLPANEPFSIYAYGSSEAFTFEPGPNPQIGQTWQMDKDVRMGNINFHVTNAELVEENGLKLVFHAKSTDPTLYVNLTPDDASLTHAVFSVPDQDAMTLSFPLSRIPDKPIKFLFSMAVYKSSIPWQVSWQPPAQAAQISGLPTSTPIPTSARLEYPTVASTNPLVLEVRDLMQKYDAMLQKGPGWVHLVHEYSKDPIPNVITIPYAREESWNEIDENGWVLRSVYVARTEDGTIIGQNASVDGYSVDLMYGKTFYNPNTYQVSIDNVSRRMAETTSSGLPYSREVTTCDDGSPCLLITSLKSIHNPKEMPLASNSGWRVWINLETGRQMKQEEFHFLEDGSIKVDYTFHYVLIEKVASAPTAILDILKNVVVP